MSKTPGCILETIAIANHAGNPVNSAIDTFRSSATTDESELPLIPCEKCGAQFSVSTELGNNQAQLMSAVSPTAKDACVTAKYRKKGDWVANLDRRWFRLSILRTSSAEVLETGSNLFQVSPFGLEITLDDAAQNAVLLHELENTRHIPLGSDEIKRLSNGLTNTVNILDLILIRHDGKSWREEVDERSTLTD